MTEKLIRGFPSIRAVYSLPGPCWDAYLSIEGPSESEIRTVAEKVERYIKRFKGARIITE